jgi:hypothetical protein
MGIEEFIEEKLNRSEAFAEYLDKNESMKRNIDVMNTYYKMFLFDSSIAKKNSKRYADLYIEGYTKEYSGSTNLYVNLNKRFIGSDITLKEFIDVHNRIVGDGGQFFLWLASKALLNNATVLAPVYLERKYKQIVQKERKSKKEINKLTKAKKELEKRKRALEERVEEDKKRNLQLKDKQTRAILELNRVKAEKVQKLKNTLENQSIIRIKYLKTAKIDKELMVEDMRVLVIRKRRAFNRGRY